MSQHFFGCYFRCQSPTQTLALIPAIHQNGRSAACSIQLLSDSGSWSQLFPAEAFRRGRSRLQIGENCFGPEGLRLNLQNPDFSASGRLRFGPPTPLNGDIMGPFRWLPFLECRHRVYSMSHSVDGCLRINGQTYEFHNGRGYTEGDSGRSFPRRYAWTQCSFPEGSLMLAAGDVPLAGSSFTGLICAILWQDRQYRLATYRGAKALRISRDEILVKQGDMSLLVRPLEQRPSPLLAPSGGKMSRCIHEHASCRVFYRFCRGNRPLFAFEAPNAAFEYEYPR